MPPKRHYLVCRPLCLPLVANSIHIVYHHCKIWMCTFCMFNMNCIINRVFCQVSFNIPSHKDYPYSYEQAASNYNDTSGREPSHSLHGGSCKRNDIFGYISKLVQLEYTLLLLLHLHHFMNKLFR